MNDYSNKNIYPNIDNGENYRLITSREIVLKLQEQENHYESVRKKYSKFSKLFQNISVYSGSCGVILSAAGIGTSLSGLFLIGLPLGSIGGFCGLLSVGSGLYSKKLNKEISKHERTSTIARTKLNSIQDLISKGLNDGKLSEEEFSRIQKEAEKYEFMKLDIRRLEKKEIGHSEINLLIKNMVEGFQKLEQLAAKSK